LKKQGKAMRFIVWTATAALLCGSLAHAHEAVFRKYDSVFIGGGGKKERIAYYTAPDEPCGANETPDISVVEQPSYGRLLLQSEKLPAPTSACAGQWIDVTSVYYEPAPTFFGSDRVVLRVNFPGAGGHPAETMMSEIYVTMR
jgi:hypothetical protein